MGFGVRFFKAVKLTGNCQVSELLRLGLKFVPRHRMRGEDHQRKPLYEMHACM